MIRPFFGLHRQSAATTVLLPSHAPRSGTAALTRQRLLRDPAFNSLRSSTSLEPRGADWLHLLVLGALLIAGTCPSLAQAVSVTLQADKNVIAVGERTTLRVLAQVLPDYRARARQIFSWHIDLVQEFGDPAELETAGAERTFSDRDPATSSAGERDGNVLRGVYDTFFGRLDAGLNAPVELLAVPLVGMREGVASFRVRAGTGPIALNDFLVAGADSSLDVTGGDYSLAATAVEVKAPSADASSLAIHFEPAPVGPGGTVTLSFMVASGRTYVVQYAEVLTASAVWRDLPGAPHSSGRVVDTASASQRFYRLVVTGG